MKSKIKKSFLWILIGVFVLSSISLTGCSTEKDKKVENNKIKIVTTIFPAFDFARAVGGDTVDVQMLLKPGVDSHSYEPSPQDMLDIKNCDIFIYLGGHQDLWVDEILESVDMSKTKVLAMTECVNPLKEEVVEGMEEHHHNHKSDHDQDGEENEVHHDHEGEAHHDQEGETEVENHNHNDEADEDYGKQDSLAYHLSHSYDEHIWTSPLNAIKIIEEIKNQLIEIDEKNKAGYEKRAEATIEKLVDIDKKIEDTVSKGNRKTLIVADRFPFRYFTERYGLEYYAGFSGCAGQSDASAKTVAFLIDKVKSENAKGIIKIELSNGKMANSIAEETGVGIYTLNSAHNLTQEEFDQGKTYLDIMEENNKVLKEVLK